MPLMSPPPSDPRPPGTNGPDRPDGPGPPRPGGSPERANVRRAIGIAVAVAVVLAFILATTMGTKHHDDGLEYSEFRDQVRQGMVASIEIDDHTGKIEGVYRAGIGPTDPRTSEPAHFTTRGPKGQLSDEDVALFEENGVSYTFHHERSSPVGSVLIWLLPIVAIVGLFAWLGRRTQGQMAGIMSIGRTRAKVYTTERPRTTFGDVAGYSAVKEEIQEVVDFLKNPGRFTDLGAKIPKGVLLVGPPGTGKTLLARAVAGEAGVPFISVTGSDFMEMFVGVGAARVRDLFETARKQAPAIVFVDEIDSIGRKRGAGLGGGHDEREQTLNQMLAEMDGFEATEGVVMMAATNRPDILDPALLRPGRFDRQIVVPLPTLEERLEILKVHVRGKRLEPDLDLTVLARGTPGMSGADLANLVNEAALHAARRGALEVSPSDIDAARDRVLMGLRRTSLVLTPQDKELVAYHEAGHALVAYMTPHADPVHKVTILPTGMALGVTQQLPDAERHLYQQPLLEDALAVALGGRIAEEVVFGTVSTGAQNDLVHATETARRMVREWGMSSRIGPMAWGGSGAVFLGEDLMHTRDYSDDTARVIDEEVERILRDQQARVRTMLSERRSSLDAVAQALLERETIDGASVGRLADEAAGEHVGGAGPGLLPTLLPPTAVVSPAVSPAGPPPVSSAPPVSTAPPPVPPSPVPPGSPVSSAPPVPPSPPGEPGRT
jgi:cell division protease FtsH